MPLSKEHIAEMLRIEAYPRSQKYDPEWLIENQEGPNVLWQMEWLCQEMKLEPGMRILDLGCGSAVSSIFLAKEFGVQVWAHDLWKEPKENWQRVRDHGVEDRVFPVRGDARSLPYAAGFFDAIVSIGAFIYFGTDDLYLPYLVQYVRPGGRIGVVAHGLVRELEGRVPQYLVDWAPECRAFRTAEWWREHWERPEVVDVRTVDHVPDAWKLWLTFEKAIELVAPGVDPSDVPVLEKDGGRHMSLIRMVADRREG